MVEVGRNTVLSERLPEGDIRRGIESTAGLAEDGGKASARIRGDQVENSVAIQVRRV